MYNVYGCICFLYISFLVIVVYYYIILYFKEKNFFKLYEFVCDLFYMFYIIIYVLFRVVMVGFFLYYVF